MTNSYTEFLKIESVGCGGVNIGEKKDQEIVKIVLAITGRPEKFRMAVSFILNSNSKIK